MFSFAGCRTRRTLDPEAPEIPKRDIITVFCEGVPLGVVVVPNWRTHCLSTFRKSVRTQVSSLFADDFRFLLDSIPISEAQEHLLPLANLVSSQGDSAKVTVTLHRPSTPTSLALVGAMCLFMILGTVLAIVLTLVGGANKNLIVEVVYGSVQLYLRVFESCWALTGFWLVELVRGYYQLLFELISLMLAWPTVLVLAIAANVALFIAYKLVTKIVPHLPPGQSSVLVL